MLYHHHLVAHGVIARPARSSAASRRFHCAKAKAGEAFGLRHPRHQPQGEAVDLTSPAPKKPRLYIYIYLDLPKSDMFGLFVGNCFFRERHMFAWRRLSRDLLFGCMQQTGRGAFSRRRFLPNPVLGRCPKGAFSRKRLV